ncbi:Y-box-binding protein 1-like [Pseudophryne corroboree]|uniref:Y-box-binding protein 1-like n=1 Tax=Pseudophryne corroboree TaxID=495146 RepID=UPI0030813352
MWFSVSHGYGFIKRVDTKQRVYVHYTGIQKTNPKECFRSLRSNDMVEFELANGKKGIKAINVTGPSGVPVKGNKYATDRDQHWCYPRYGGPPHNFQRNDQYCKGGERMRVVESATDRRNAVPPQPEERGVGENPMSYLYPERYGPANEYSTISGDKKSMVVHRNQLKKYSSSHREAVESQLTEAERSSTPESPCNSDPTAEMLNVFRPV